MCRKAYFTVNENEEQCKYHTVHKIQGESLEYLVTSLVHRTLCCLLISLSMSFVIYRVYDYTRFLYRGGRSHDTRLEKGQGGIGYL
jgi:hypothetical protein